MNRQELKNKKRIVVKIGTTSLTYQNGKLNLRRIGKLATVLSDLRNQGKEVILVSSGAIAVGSDRLSLTERPRDVRLKQAASAVGQAVLMQIYENFFTEYNQKIAQILLTKDVVDEPLRKQYARDTFFTLLNMGVIPIVNENDTVAIDELDITFSENDMLSAYVTCLTDSDLLILLSDNEGLYDDDPRQNPDAKLIEYVENITEDIVKIAGGSGTTFGTGGAAAKLAAARMVTEQGIDMVIALGQEPAILYDILDGHMVGTLFSAK